MNTAARWYFVDALRILAFALLVPYHVGMYYVSWGWHVKSAQLVPALEPLMRSTSPWRMSLLFLLAGTAFALMLASPRGASPWLGARLKRLGWPLLLGIAVLVPPQSYFEVQRVGYAGSYGDFLKLYFSAYGGFCAPGGGCLILPTWNHLWFLAYLISYTALLAIALRRWPQLPQRLAEVAEPVLSRSLWLLVVPTAYLVLTRLLLRDRFPSTHALVDDFYQHSQFMMFFMLGLALGHARAAWQRFERLRWPALAIASLAWFTLVWLAPGHGPLGMLVVSLQQWCAIVAAGGFAHRHLHLHHDSAWRRYFTEAMLPLYLLHQTVIILAAMSLRPLSLQPLLEGPLLVLLAFGVSLGIYELVRRVRVLRPLFGLPAVAALALLGVGSASAAPAAPVAEWWTPGFSARVRIEPCGQALCGHIVWAWDDRALGEDKPTLVGRKVIDGMRTETATRWSQGSLADPEDGREYRGSIEMRGPNHLLVRGCVLMICRTQLWRRYDANRIPPVA